MTEFLTPDEKCRMLQEWAMSIKSRNDETFISKLCKKFMR